MTNIPPLPPNAQARFDAIAQDSRDRIAMANEDRDMEGDSDAVRQQRSRYYVENAAEAYVVQAIHELGSLMTNPKAGSAQVQACKEIIAWSAGKPGRYVNIGDMKGKTVHESMDMVFAAIAEGRCSMEDGKELIDMLSKRAGREVEALGQELEKLQRMLEQRGV